MTNQKILDNAPDGATHIDNCGFYLKAGKSGFMEPDNLSNDWDYEYSNHSEVSSLADIKRIAELDALVVRITNCEQIFSDTPDLEFSKFKEMFPDEFEAHNLEQQAKGVEDAANDLTHSIEATIVYVADLDERVTDLRNQAKALKEQG